MRRCRRGPEAKLHPGSAQRLFIQTSCPLWYLLYCTVLRCKSAVYSLIIRPALVTRQTRSNGERSRPTLVTRRVSEGGPPRGIFGMRGGLQVIRRLVEYGALGLVHRHGECGQKANTYSPCFYVCSTYIPRQLMPW
jgi:hypothetical protein